MEGQPTVPSSSFVHLDVHVGRPRSFLCWVFVLPLSLLVGGDSFLLAVVRFDFFMSVTVVDVFGCQIFFWMIRHFFRNRRGARFLFFCELTTKKMIIIIKCVNLSRKARIPKKEEADDEDEGEDSAVHITSVVVLSLSLRRKTRRPFSDAAAEVVDDSKLSRKGTERRGSAGSSTCSKLLFSIGSSSSLSLRSSTTSNDSGGD